MAKSLFTTRRSFSTAIPTFQTPWLEYEQPMPRTTIEEPIMHIPHYLHRQIVHYHRLVPSESPIQVHNPRRHNPIYAHPHLRIPGPTQRRLDHHVVLRFPLFEHRPRAEQLLPVHRLLLAHQDRFLRVGVRSGSLVGFFLHVSQCGVCFGDARLGFRFPWLWEGLFVLVLLDDDDCCSCAGEGTAASVELLAIEGCASLFFVHEACRRRFFNPKLAVIGELAFVHGGVVGLQAIGSSSDEDL
ncbi:uncharacterized protein G2W53_029982 [Senna tora]|uniref:Uncharacterized protein n=1 Tax=Senna tora TaxID=362788 RepID=A0A834T6H7_9FABA|nr:uncharacterized protein G2W53_029982 [Senna tora]